MELIDLNVTITIFVKLVKAILKGEAPLNQDFDQMIEDFVLGVLDFALLLNLSHSLDIVALVELFEFLVSHNAVFVTVNLIEERTTVFVLDC